MNNTWRVNIWQGRNLNNLRYPVFQMLEGWLYIFVHINACYLYILFNYTWYSKPQICKYYRKYFKFSNLSQQFILAYLFGKFNYTCNEYFCTCKSSNSAILQNSIKIVFTEFRVKFPEARCTYLRMKYAQ